MTTYNENTFVYPIPPPPAPDGTGGIADALLGTVQRRYVRGALGPRDAAYVAEARALLAGSSLAWRGYCAAVAGLVEGRTVIQLELWLEQRRAA